MFHWLQRVRHFKPVLVAQRWLNLFQGYPIPQGLSTQSRPEGRDLNPRTAVGHRGNTIRQTVPGLERHGAPVREPTNQPLKEP